MATAKRIWIIENHSLSEDDDYRQIFTYDADWSQIHEGYTLVGEYHLVERSAEM